MVFSLIYYWIKNQIKSIELPKDQWFDNVMSPSLIDSISHIKFYATKNWIEIYVKDSVWFDSKNPQFTESQIPNYKNQNVSLIVPKWKIKVYGKNNNILITDENKKSLEFVGVSKRDYERYLEWNKK